MSHLELGIQAFKSNQYKQALEVLQPLAERGNSEAQCIVANIYHLGLGVQKNVSEAVNWYRKAAKQGHPIAANNLAGIFLVGDSGVNKDREEAQQWYQLSQIFWENRSDSGDTEIS